MQFKIVLDKRYKKKDGNYPLKLRVFQGSGWVEKSIGISISEDNWDDIKQEVTGTIYDRVYNNKINEVKVETEKKILLDSPSIEEVLDRKKQKKAVLVSEYGAELVKNLQISKRDGSAKSYNCCLTSLGKFKKGVTFNDLTYPFLREFESHLYKEGLKTNSVGNYMRSLRALANLARKEQLTTVYGFSDYKIRVESTISRKLTVDQMSQIYHLKPREEKSAFYRDLFLVSFMLGGINFSDIATLERSSIQENYIVYKRKKTHKLYMVIMHPFVTAFINKNQGEHYLLPIIDYTPSSADLKYKLDNYIKYYNTSLNRAIKPLNWNFEISSYWARYTFANLAKKLGYSKDLISELLGHSYGLTVTSTYLSDYEQEEKDKCLLHVVNYFLDYCGANDD